MSLLWTVCPKRGIPFSFGVREQSVLNYFCEQFVLFPVLTAPALASKVQEITH